METYSGKIDWLVIFNVILRHRWLFLGVPLLFTVCATGYTIYGFYYGPPTYTSTATFYMKDVPSVQGGLSDVVTSKSPYDYLVGLARSRSVADSIIDQLELLKRFEDKRKRNQVSRDDIYAVLERVVKIEQGENRTILVKATDMDADFAVKLVNAYMDALTGVLKRLTRQRSQAERDYLGKHLETKKRELAELEEKVRRFSEQSGIVQLDTQSELTIRRIASLEKQIARNNVTLAELRSSLTDNHPRIIELLVANEKLREELDERESVHRASKLPLSERVLQHKGLEYASLKRSLELKGSEYTELKLRYDATFTDLERTLPVVLLDSAGATIEGSLLKQVVRLMIKIVVVFISGAIISLLLEYWRLMPSDRQTRWRGVMRNFLPAIK